MKTALALITAILAALTMAACGSTHAMTPAQACHTARHEIDSSADMIELTGAQALAIRSQVRPTTVTAKVIRYDLAMVQSDNDGRTGFTGIASLSSDCENMVHVKMDNS